MKETFDRFGMPVVAAGVGVSLLLNIVLMSQWFAFRNRIAEVTPQIESAVEQGIEDLAAFRASSIEFTVDVDETVAIDTTFPVAEQFTLPVNTNLPINEAFESRIEVQGPFGLGIPVTVNIPVNLDVPIDLMIPVELETNIDVNLDVPLQLEIPLAIDVADTNLATLTARLESSLRALSDALSEVR